MSINNTPQLIMYWENDGKKPTPYTLPQGVTIERFTERATALTDWLETVHHGITHEVRDEAYYKVCMLDHPGYDENLCFFLVKDGVAAATITVICDYEKKEGYIHMVACKEQFRGLGYGNLLNEIAVEALKNEGMKTAYLTTDDWRIPAIKSYLKYGFTPDVSTDDFKERWDKIYDIINAK